MAEKVRITIDVNDPVWKAFFEGKISSDDLLQRKYGDPLLDAANDAAVVIGQKGLALLNGTITGWNHRPEFAVGSRITKDRLGGKVEMKFIVYGSYEYLWNWINKGTKPHRIPKGGLTRKGGRIRMPMRPYLPHTQPGSIVSSPGRGVHGGPIAFSSSVIQSIPARNFSFGVAEALGGTHTGSAHHTTSQKVSQKLAVIVRTKK